MQLSLRYHSRHSPFASYLFVPHHLHLSVFAPYRTPTTPPLRPALVACLHTTRQALSRPVQRPSSRSVYFKDRGVYIFALRLPIRQLSRNSRLSAASTSASLETLRALGRKAAGRGSEPSESVSLSETVSSASSNGSSSTFQAPTPNSTLPAFLRQSKAEKHAKFIDLEWQQRNRLAKSFTTTDPTSEWARVSGDEVVARNRYVNVEPYLNKRVNLKVPEGHNDYINASPIILVSTTSAQERRYIATQGPKESSYSHIWRMIHHETDSPAVIVMLTKTHESGKEKCFEYYPTSPKTPLPLNASNEFGDGLQGRVSLVETFEDQPSRSTIRRLNLSLDGASKTVHHLLFTGWPDFLIPEGDDRLALLSLVQRSLILNNSSVTNPRIVHCSAGVGRSGTFIALDYLLSELASGALDAVPDDVDRIADTVDVLRRQRMMMVQGELQFHFLYDVLREQWLERHAGQASSQVQEAKEDVKTDSEVERKAQEALKVSGEAARDADQTAKE
ncbi:protein-tyrosine phosphatase-like protein [Cryomyces antarcticus]